MRQILCPSLAGRRYVMTRHLPARGGCSDRALALFNNGQVPRDGHAGLAVQLATVAARQGITTYRIDLPGLGDAPGPLPVRVDLFWQQNETGQQAAAAALALDYIRSQCQHSRLFAGGLCGAANNALFCYADKPELIDGLLLIEPQFFFTQIATASGTSELRASRLSASARLRQRWSRLLTAENRYTRPRPRVRRALMALAPKRVLLGGSTNLPLAHAYAAACRNQVPILCIVEGNGRRAIHLERIERALHTPGAGRWVDKTELLETNHVLTEGGAIEQCCGAVADWLSAQG